jgi:uncharacterized pyridoxamine 5'-phosphate oxidase family protein
MDKNILNTLKPTQMVHVATCEGFEPRVRPMTMICLDGRLYFATGSSDNKSSQIAANPHAEFCLLLPGDGCTGYLRGRGRLRQVDEVVVKKGVADFATFIYNYWRDAADPGFRLYEMELSQLRYMEPGADLEEVTDLA